MCRERCFIFYTHAQYYNFSFFILLLSCKYCVFWNEFFYGEFIQYFPPCESSISMSKYKYLSKLSHGLFLFVLVFWIFHLISFVYYRNVKIQSFIFLINSSIASLSHLFEKHYLVKCLIFQVFNLLSYIFCTYYLNRSITIINRFLVLPKYSWNLWNDWYHPM